MLNLTRIAILAGFMLAAGPSLALPSQASAGERPPIGKPSEPGEHNGIGLEDILDGREFGLAHPDGVPPDMPWTAMGEEHGPPGFDRGPEAGGWDDRWSRVPDNPHGCSSPGKPGCDFIGSLTPGDIITSPVPEPETYALMLAGLALLRLAVSRARRRQS